jgi:ABC-type nitrate/sulfonate/bicarbonate transport system substrate-binding protein
MIRSVNTTLVLVLLILPMRVSAQEKYIASYAGFAGFQAPLWAAKDFGFLTKHGVNTDLVMIPGSARGAQAMLGGSIHFGQIDGTALISAINQGADLVFVASSLNKFPFSLVAQKNIHQPKDLVGKKVGIVASVEPMKFLSSWHSRNGIFRASPSRCSPADPPPIICLRCRAARSMQHCSRRRKPAKPRAWACRHSRT